MCAKTSVKLQGSEIFPTYNMSSDTGESQFSFFDVWLDLLKLPEVILTQTKTPKLMLTMKESWKGCSFCLALRLKQMNFTHHLSSKVAVDIMREVRGAWRGIKEGLLEILAQEKRGIGELVRKKTWYNITRRQVHIWKGRDSQALVKTALYPGKTLRASLV